MKETQYQNRGIISVGTYLPHLRLDRAIAAQALRFSGLAGRAAGHRAVASWDEDAVTMAAEAARFALQPDALVFASTSAPFYERSHASLIVDALALPKTTRSKDVAGSRRCGASALLDAFFGLQDTLVTAGEKRPAQAGSGQHLTFGDGAASVLVSDGGAARLVGHASTSTDYVDFYSAREHPTPYAYEERFIKETATRDIIAPAIMAALTSANLSGSDIAQAAVIEPCAGMWRDIARATGISAPNHATDLATRVGDLGAAHPLFALALALDAAKPGDKILLSSFGSGCDVLIFEVNGIVPGAAEARVALDQGQILNDYVRFLSLTQGLNLDWGMRSEFEQKAQATVLARNGREMMGFIGGRDSAGNVQFPKTRIPVRPDAEGPEVLEDVRLADLPATLISITADRLNFSPDPPFYFGLVQFENGARVMMELVDSDSGFNVGDNLKMRFRIKSHDKRRGFRTYFWKAAPADRPTLEASNG